MSRHRNFRKLNYDEECDIDDVYGRSVEDDYCISPNTAAQFMYDRNAQTHSISSYLASGEIPEEELEPEDDHLPSHHPQLLKLNPIDEARLQSCLDEIHNIVGDNISDFVLREAIVANRFDIEKSLDAVLSNKIRTTEQSKRQVSRNDRGINQEKKNNGEQLIEASRQTESAIKNGNGFTIPDPGDGELTSRVKEEIGSELNAIGDEKAIVEKPSVKNKEVGNSGPSAKLDVAKAYEKQRASNKELLNLVVIGHVDAGKSTLMGHLLYLVGAVSQKAMHKYEQESKKIGKTSFMYAWVLDETGEERSRGITMDVGKSKMETATRSITLLDAPGHKDFIPNMITGASQADVAILVVDATRGEFETGFESGGQTREHALLVRSLGVSQLAVAVNKMDTVKWSVDRFNEIIKKLGQFLKQVGYKEADVSYIPCSGLLGENLKDPPTQEELNKWYRGPTLLQQIDNFKSLTRPISKPLRISVGDIFKGQFTGFCVAGRIETGVISNGDRVLVMPQAEIAQVKGVTIDDLSVSTAFAGDQVVLNLTNIDMTNVMVGNLLCDISQPVRTTSHFQARIVIFNIDVPITKGFPVVLHYQMSSEPAVIKKLVCQLHRNTGELVKKKPRCLGKQTSAVVEIELSRPICVELYKDIKELGRFMLRSKGSTIAAGLVTEIY